MAGSAEGFGRAASVLEKAPFPLLWPSRLWAPEVTEFSGAATCMAISELPGGPPAHSGLTVAAAPPFLWAQSSAPQTSALSDPGFLLRGRCALSVGSGGASAVGLPAPGPLSVPCTVSQQLVYTMLRT